LARVGDATSVQEEKFIEPFVCLDAAALSREMDLIWTTLGAFGLKHLLVARCAIKAALKSDIKRELRATGWHATAQITRTSSVYDYVIKFCMKESICHLVPVCLFKRYVTLYLVNIIRT
jgi:hypothetical protein